ncbi:MAG: chemotaxis protein CheB [Pseudomonadota bacterium]
MDDSDHPAESVVENVPVPKLSDSLCVVGIGASAGGLEAIRELVKNLPGDIGATYVIVQHMSPLHKSLLTTLIDRETHLSVIDITDGVKPAANTIYVTPPNNDVVYRDGVLHLLSPSEEVAAPKPSVDRFFMSIAEASAERAVGIVLSGTGSDGAYGIQAIRAAGGITIAQDDKSAKYDGMPIAAVETGCVDLVLSPLEAGTHLAKILTLPRDLDQFRTEEVNEHPLSELLQIVLARTRVDFRSYKPTTIQRRLERRMNALGITGQTDYTMYCRSNPREIDALFKDLLISVTRFFRDPEEFMALKPIVKKLVEERQNRPIRVWITGCATGEEAYSIAMLFAEACGGEKKLTKDILQIFATDIDRNALEIARRGRYSFVAMDDIPDAYVSRYFTRDDDGMIVNRAIKDVILFSEHNLCQDPPFLNVDLICCRNLLIYFGAALQEKVLSRLHYSMTREGVIFLGTAESVSVSDDLFRPIARGNHIYRKRFLARMSERSRPNELIPTNPRWSAARDPIGAVAPQADQALERSLFEGLARTLGPDALLLSDDYRILQVFGDVGPYISLTEKSRLQLSISMLVSELAQDARTLTTLALKNSKHRTGIQHRLSNFPDEIVQLDAYPLNGQSADERFVLLVIRREREETQQRKPVVGNEGDKDTLQITMLEQELSSTREALQQTIEELETSNEELQSTNEELQSTNEELQATNEELETSNEELQSTNEELVTVNEELQVSTMELTIMADEQEAILEHIASPLLIVDSALQVLKASRAAIELFAFRRPVDQPHISQISVPPGFPPLADICNESLHLGKSLVREFVAEERAYTLECAPFSNKQGQIQGATIVFMESPAAARLANELQHFVNHAPVMMVQWDTRGKIMRLSRRTASRLDTSIEAAMGKSLYDFFEEADAESIIQADKMFLESERGEQITDYHVTLRETGRKLAITAQRYRFFSSAIGEPTIFAVLSDLEESAQD